MKTWIPLSLLLVAATSPAFAQPRPPLPRHDDHRDERKDPPREERKEAVAVAEVRERFQQRQDQARDHRKDARRDAKAWRDGRMQRAEEHNKEIAATWGSAVNRPEARAELATHADRMARLNRVLDVAEDKGDAALTARAKLLIQREIGRDANAMQEIRTKAGAQ